MFAQRLYDLCVKADREASENDLERTAFLLDSLPGLNWLKELLKEDAPRLSPMVAEEAHPLAWHEALFLCASYSTREDFTGRIAGVICRRKELAFRPPLEVIQRRVVTDAQPNNNSPSPTQQLDRTPPAQRLYRLITALDAVATTKQIKLVAELLCHFQADVLDRSTLIQDAPRLSAEMSRYGQLARVHNWDPLTYHSWFVDGHDVIDRCLQHCHGVIHAIAQALSDLFQEFGALADISKEHWHLLRSTGQVPRQISVQRADRTPHPTCLYIWMFDAPDGFRFDRPLSPLVKNWDKAIVETMVQPCASARLKPCHLIVCIAHNESHAKELVESYARHWNHDYLSGHLSQRMETASVQDVFFLDTEERPRAIFVSLM